MCVCVCVLQVNQDDDELLREDEEETSEGQPDAAAMFLLCGGEKRLHMELQRGLMGNDFQLLMTV